ncbi:MAG: DivIVA domain-containing protein [Firmicutes bacterium]|jgi:cell division initiation protein|nr:DivIVA domain-containing protein [Candidatus Fermentithermobacillaceae bacterium]
MDQERTKPPIPRISTLTPLDIHNKEFSRGFRGYNEEEVDEFLDLIVAEFEGLIRENEELRGTIGALEMRLDHYKGLEDTLKNAIVLAQKAADQIREAAEREADAVTQDARRQAEITLREAESTRKKTYEEFEVQRQKVVRFKTEMRAFLQSALQMFDENLDSVTESLLEGKSPPDNDEKRFFNLKDILTN